MRSVVTGDRGFIGSHFVYYVLTDEEVGEEVKVIGIDKRTYAGQANNLGRMGIKDALKKKHKSIDQVYRPIRADISDAKTMDDIFNELTRKEPIDMVFNFAAETHVDNSLKDVSPFIQSNITGTFVLLEIAKKDGVKRFIQVSTDEVYGSLGDNDLPWNESCVLNPRNPYSTCKATAEMFARNASREGLPVIITRSANNYGPFQYPEKFLSLSITNLIDGYKIPLMWSEENPGLNKRDWLHVEDNCRAIWRIYKNGTPGKTYNIPGNNERKNIEVANLLLAYFGFGEDKIEHIKHRKGHDHRYFITGYELTKLGFQYKHTDFEYELGKTIEWYKNNQRWWRFFKPLKNEK